MAGRYELGIEASEEELLASEEEILSHGVCQFISNTLG